MNPLFLSVITLVPLGLTACSKPAAQAGDASLPAEPEPVAVTTQPVAEQPMPRYLRVTGELKGAQEAMVAADASGKVAGAPIERGTVVKAGEVLIRLDDRNAALSLAEAEATLVSARLKMELQQTELKRNEPLAKTKAISDTDFQRFKIDFASAEASLAASQARLDMARKALADATIVAPFDGTVAERLVEVGEYVSANSQVASLVAAGTLRLVLNVPETSSGGVHSGQKVSFNVPAWPGVEFSGNIRFIGAAVRQASRDLVVEAEVPNAEGRLKPGMFAEGRIALEEQKSLTVPARAVLADGTTRRAFVVVKDHLEERLVEVGETRDGLVEIRRGLTAGEAVVVKPGPGFADGRKIKTPG